MSEPGSEQVLGEVALELQDATGRCYERIRGTLLHEVIGMLPEPPEAGSTQPPGKGASIRQTLAGWLATPGAPAEVDVSTLRQLEADLYEFAHNNPTELGMVGRLHPDVTGRVVDLTNVEPIMARTSSTVVLGLALRRFILLRGRGYTARIVREPVGAET